MQNVVIYSTPTCGYCRMAKQFFDEHGVSYTEKDVAADAEARQEMLMKTQQLGVPVIEVGDNLMVGYDPKHLAHLLGISIA